MRNRYAIENHYTNPEYEGMSENQIRACIDTKDQFYKGIKLNCIVRRDYGFMKAKRFTLKAPIKMYGFRTIPNKHLEKDGTIKEGDNIDYVFIHNHRQCELAGINLAVCLQGISNYGRRFVL